jgi:hypothetical protein
MAEAWKHVVRTSRPLGQILVYAPRDFGALLDSTTRCVHLSFVSLLYPAHPDDFITVLHYIPRCSVRVKL